MKKYLQRALCLLLLAVAIVLVYRGLDYVISDDTKTQMRITLHDFYETDHIDILFSGTSHSVHAINAQQMTDELDKSVFSVCSTAQEPVGGYYLLKEALEAKDIKTVYYELSFSRLVRDEVNETATFILTDYMRNKLNVADFVTYSFDSDKYVHSFLRLRRNLDPMLLPTLPDMDKLYDNKQKEEYKEFIGDEEKYFGRGSWGVTNSCGYEDTIAIETENNNLDNHALEDINPQQWECFMKIIDLCKEKGVDLTIYMTPYEEYWLDYFENYEEFHQLVADALKEKGVTFLDLNLVKDEYLHLEHSEFYNMDHVNNDGMKKVSDFLVQYISDPDGDYFVKSLDEKFPDREGIFAIGYNSEYYSSDEEFHKYWTAKQSKKKILTEKIQVFALSKEGDYPAITRIWLVEQDPDTEEWIELKELKGTKIDKYMTEFELDFSTDNRYRVQLIDPDTEEVMYETISKLCMD